jgi:hypothetical protein
VYSLVEAFFLTQYLDVMKVKFCFKCTVLVHDFYCSFNIISLSVTVVMTLNVARLSVLIGFLDCDVMWTYR